MQDIYKERSTDREQGEEEQRYILRVIDAQGGLIIEFLVVEVFGWIVEDT